MTHIVHLLQSSDGGGYLQALELARHSLERGNQIAVATPDVPSRSGFDGIAHEQLPTTTIGRSASIWRLSRRADILHVHGTRAASWALPILPFATSVVTFHGLHPLRRGGGPAYRLAAWGLVTSIVMLADAVVCVSQGEADELERRGFPQSKVHVVRNAVAPEPRISAEEAVAARTALGLPAGALVVLFIGRLHDQKNPLAAVEVGARLRDEGVLLLVAGDGDLMSAAQAAATDNVRLLGRRTDIRTLLAAADVLLSTSLWEGLPLTLLEAMWGGIPVVASDVAGNAEALADTGLLVPVGDVETFAAALLRLRDPDERARLASAARARVESEFRLDEMLARTDQVYVAAARGSPRTRQ